MEKPDSLIEQFNKMSLSDISKSISDTNDIDELSNLIDNLAITNYSTIQKRQIMYWISLQTDTINKQLMNKETLQYGLAF